MTPPTQIDLPAEELERLKHRIDEDYASARADHHVRMERFARAYEAWRSRVDNVAMEPGGEDRPNFRVPLIKWHVMAKVANNVEALFGPDADITAEPTGPVDAKIVRKVARFMRYMFMSRMDATRDVAAFEFRRILLGRAHAYVPWVRRAHRHPDGHEVLAYEGPKWINLLPDDIIVPSEEVASIHEFSWVIRRSVETFDELIVGEQAGRYQNIAKNQKQILEHAAQHRTRFDQQGAETRDPQDAAEGVNRNESLSGRNGVLVYHWYGRWRMLKGRHKSAEELDLTRREPVATDLLVKYIPELHMVIGVQKLRDIYPEHASPRPFVEAGLIPDGSYWGPGFFELLEEIEREITAINNLGVKAGEMSVSPPVFYDPASGVEPDKLRLEPGMAYPSNDPRAVNTLQVSADLSFPIAWNQELKALGERLSGVTDLNMGRTQAGPNAPRTLGQTQLLLEQSDVRGAFDLRMLREAMRGALRHVWELAIAYLPEQTFFRITEEEAGGLFNVRQGFASLDAADRTGHYDFDLKFATSKVGKDAEKERQLALYQIDVGNPLILNNPRALYHITVQLHRAFGDEQFERLVPKPPDDELTLPPDEEHTMMLQGEDVHVRPGDDDLEHLTAHHRMIERLQKEASEGRGDPDGLRRLVEHYQEQMAQLQKKRLMQALVKDVQRNLPSLLGGLGAGGAGGATPPGQPPNI